MGVTTNLERGSVRARLASLLGAALLVMLPAEAALAVRQSVSFAVETHTLENGLRLVLRPDTKAPLVSFQVWYGVGSRDEQFGMTGVSHFLEHLMFQGAARHGIGEFDRRLVKVGARNNAFTTKDGTVYYEVLPRAQLELAFDLESDRMTGAAIPPEKFDSEKQVVREELRWRSENNPVGACWELLTGMTYLAHPYHWPVGGYPQDLAAITRDEVVAYYKRHYQPGNATVVITGDFEPDHALRLARQYFGAIQGIPVSGRVARRVAEARGERRGQMYRPVTHPAVLFGYRLPGSGHPDLIALELLQLILAEGESSRFYRALVREQRLARTVEMGLDEGLDGSVLYLYAQPMPGVSLEKLERAIDAAIQRAKQQLASPTELKKAVNMARARFIKTQESAEGMANLLGQAIHTGGLDSLDAYLPRLAALAPTDPPRIATRYLTPDNRTVVQLLPESSVRPTEKR
jgi:zinc protease